MSEAQATPEFKAKPFDRFDFEQTVSPCVFDRRDARVLAETMGTIVDEMRESDANLRAGLWSLDNRLSGVDGRLDRQEGLLRLMATALNIPDDQIDKVLKDA